jgi:hypothetical protein
VVDLGGEPRAQLDKFGGRELASEPPCVRIVAASLEM